MRQDSFLNFSWRTVWPQRSAQSMDRDQQLHPQGDPRSGLRSVGLLAANLTVHLDAVAARKYLSRASSSRSRDSASGSRGLSSRHPSRVQSRKSMTQATTSFSPTDTYDGDGNRLEKSNGQITGTAQEPKSSCNCRYRRARSRKCSRSHRRRSDRRRSPRCCSTSLLQG